MKPQDIFGVVVRGIGLIVAVVGIHEFLSGLGMTFEGGGVGYVFRQLIFNVIIVGGGITVIGLALMRWADVVVGFAYGKPLGARGFEPVANPNATAAAAATVPGEA